MASIIAAVDRRDVNEPQTSSTSSFSSSSSFLVFLLFIYSILSAGVSTRQWEFFPTRYGKHQNHGKDKRGESEIVTFSCDPLLWLSFGIFWHHANHVYSSYVISCSVSLLILSVIYSVTLPFKSSILSTILIWLWSKPLILLSADIIL